jgi:hypothetical membrane protein
MNSAYSIRFVRGLGGIAVAGVIVFVAGIALAGFAYPGYSHVDQMISELGGVDATHAWIQNTNFMVFGLTAIGLAVALMLDARRVFAGAVLLVVLGFSGTFMEGVVNCDTGCKGETTEGAIHLMFGLVGFVCGVVALFLLARRFRREPRWARHVTFTRACAWAALAGLILFIVSNGAPAVDGLAQRLFVLPLLVFIAGTGWRLATDRVGDL